MNTSIDQATATPARSAFRPRPVLWSAVLLLMCSFLGAAALSDVSTNFIDVAKIIAVAAFIGAMVALALGMIGDAYRD